MAGGFQPRNYQAYGISIHLWVETIRIGMGGEVLQAKIRKTPRDSRF
jgi:hypothetical protein